MISANSNASRLCAERLARFQQRPEVRRTAEQYADWSQSAAGNMVNTQLSYLAMARMAGKLTRATHRNALDKLAKGSGIPLDDFRILARCVLELVRCALAATDQVANADWNTEGEDA